MMALIKDNVMKNKVFYLVDKKKFYPLNNDLRNLLPDYVRIKFLYCGICGGDYSSFLGHRTTFPISLGHEFIAKVIETGENVTDFKKNDLVTSDLNFRCGKCSNCLTGKEHFCIYSDTEYFSNRAFAEYADIHKNYLYNINFFNNMASAALIEPLSCVIHAYNEVTRICNPLKILIVGLGSIGMLFAFYLKMVIKKDSIFVHDSIPERKYNIIHLFQCRAMESDASPDYDLIIDATNSIMGVHFCLEISKPTQVYCMMSHLYGMETSFIYETMCKKEIHPLFPRRNGGKHNFLSAIQIINDYWKSDYDAALGIYPISQIQDVFERKSSMKNNKQILYIDLES